MGDAADGELKGKIDEYRARERIYFAALIEQESEMNRLRRTSHDVNSSYGDVTRAAVRGAFVDTTSNMEVLLLREKAREKDRQITRLRDELQANQFQQQAPAGQALVRKCKMLLEENRLLGEQMREDRVQELKAVLEAEQRENAKLQEQCLEAAQFCKVLSEENEKLQSSVAKVAQKLRDAEVEVEEVRIVRNDARAKRKEEKRIQKMQTVQAAAAANTAAMAAAAAAAAKVSDEEVVAVPALEPVVAPPVPPLVADAGFGDGQEKKVHKEKRPREGKEGKEKKEKKHKSDKARAETVAVPAGAGGVVPHAGAKSKPRGDRGDR
eukprot:gnl/TRDRNA2_/TRDRNA2_187103_c0_seq1.p1 gnl/TRDRNA2_/TRDRNA2_187103_c0~~gnl/TRDRNA2_/TRDRNA2_187103_c0_seq1.p1  ORF type:complete len:360 (-),score=100.85 gnl/TRDRNA2_/TRDRNA2_187103_c0_seq1:101-1072(-)